MPHVRAKFDAAKVKPDDCKSLADIVRFPFATKADLRDTYPFGLFAVPREQILRLHASSGTTGKATVVGYTQGDLETWTDLMARCMACAGARPGDIVHNGYGYGLFTGGLGAHYGAERLGCTVVPVSGGMTERQVTLLQDFGAHVLCATPSYALNIAEVAEGMGVDIRKLPLRIGIFGAEPWSDAMRRDLEARLGFKAVDLYGLSEIIGPGVACECHVARNGLHGWEDHFLFEVIDPKTLEPVADGEPGELVITTLTKEALPMVRYRSRDITRLTHEPCACGRTHVRIMRVTGRDDDMLIIRGVNVFPSQIEAVLVGLPGVAPHYQIVLTREGALDAMTVEVEMAPGADRRRARQERGRRRAPDQVAHRRHLRRRGQSARRGAALAGQGGARQGPAQEISRAMNNADLIVATLKAAGIDRGFGIPSGNVLPLMEAMRKGGVDFVLTAHEGSAGFAADVTGRLTGAPGPVHRDARPRRHQSRDRRRQRLARPLADDRHHLQSQHRPARPPHPDVDRPSRAVQADHQGNVPPGERQDRRDGEGGHSPRHERAARPGASRPARGRGAGAGARATRRR